MVHVKAGVHYDVQRMELHGESVIKSLTCNFCPFWVSRSEFSKKRADGQRGSGLPRYNRMRAALSRHLHEEHRDGLVGCGKCENGAVDISAKLGEPPANVVLSYWDVHIYCTCPLGQALLRAADRRISGET